MTEGVFNAGVEGAFGESLVEPITERGDGIEVAEVFVLEARSEGVHVGTELGIKVAVDLIFVVNFIAFFEEFIPGEDEGSGEQGWDWADGVF
jgi:hypothetical protein